jgi:CBS domain-containing protein
MGELRAWLTSAGDVAKHQGFPVLDASGKPLGVLTRRTLFDASVPDDVTVGSLVSRPPLAVHEDHTLREAADHMVEADVGRLIVLGKGDSPQMVGILTRGDLLKAHAQRLREARRVSRHLGQK